MDPDQTDPTCSGFMLFASILNSSVMLGNYLQQTISADDILDAFFLGALRIKYFSLDTGIVQLSQTFFLKYSKAMSCDTDLLDMDLN